MSKYDEYGKKIFKYLKKTYEEKGETNFHFKSKQLKEEMKLDARVIGRVIKYHIPPNKVKPTNTPRPNYRTSWKTTF